MTGVVEVADHASQLDDSAKAPWTRTIVGGMRGPFGSSVTMRSSSGPSGISRPVTAEVLWERLAAMPRPYSTRRGPSAGRPRPTQPVVG